MSKHTPGPWRVIPRDGKFPNAVQRGREGGFEVRGLDNETEDADARLIASAPEMLEALLEAVECGMVPVSSAKEGGASAFSAQVRCADRIRAAIAKATGEA